MKLHRELTLVLPHFQNLGMWAEQQKVWASYRPEMRERLHVIVVDDCSPEGLYPTPESVTVEGLASLRIMRLQEKKRWNWPACRNLGAKLATTDWMVLTDIDHVIPPSTMGTILNMKLDPFSAYQFERVTATKTWPYERMECTDYKPHNDSFLLTRGLFFDHRVSGYDERLSGCYGTSGEFRDRLKNASKKHLQGKDELLPCPIVRYPREIIADASTHPSVYTRKGDPENDAELSRLKAERNKEIGWRPLHGLIPYDEVFSISLTEEPVF